MGHPDFRVKGKIFATLGYPDEGWGMVKLAPEQQRMFVQANPEVFVLAREAWGLRGRTLVRLRAANADTVREAMTAAWLGRAPKIIVRDRVVDRLAGQLAARPAKWIEV